MISTGQLLLYYDGKTLLCSVIFFRLDESLSLEKLGLSDACLATLASEG